jgi:quercetin dioxygenase-like cupin family protein
MAEPKAQRVAGADPVKVDSKHYKTELENEYMRVLRVSYGPGEKSVMHSHPDFVALFLNDINCRFTLPDGSTENHRWKAGEVFAGAGGEHLPENTGSQRFEVLLFELKPKTGARQPRLEHDSTKVDAKHYKVEFENDRVRVVRARYGAHEKSTMHDHPALAVTFLTDYQGRFTYPDGRTEEFTGKAGQVSWSPAVKHLPENLSDKPIEVVLVEMKS